MWKSENSRPLAPQELSAPISSDQTRTSKFRELLPEPEYAKPTADLLRTSVAREIEDRNFPRRFLPLEFGP
jgi:hypothetical protein